MGKSKQVPEKGINIRFPDHVHRRIVEVASREGRSLNAAVIDAILLYLKNRGYEIDFLEDRTEEKESRSAAG